MKSKCPTCRRESMKEGNKLFPFCSERCHLLDLGKWLDEEYRIAERSDSSGGGIESAVPPSEDER